MNCTVSYYVENYFFSKLNPMSAVSVPVPDPVPNIDTNTNIDYNSYVKSVTEMDGLLNINLFETYEESRDIFDDVFFNKNLILDNNTGNEQYHTRTEIVGLHKYLFCNEQADALVLWKNLIESNNTCICTHTCTHTYKRIDRTMLLLAQHYRWIEKDYEKAIHYYGMAIEKNNGWAMFNLAMYYEDVVKDYEKAVLYYKQAVETGNGIASNALAVYYDVVEKNSEKAVCYYGLAIEKGVNVGLYNLALCYKDIGDLEKAEHYLINGLSLGDGDCIRPLMNVFKQCDKLKFDSILPIVQTIVSNEKLHGYYKNVQTVLNNAFVEWKILNTLSNVLDEKFINILNSLEDDFDVVQYKYKVNRATRYGNYDTCPICLESSVLNIEIGCSHGVCPKCYEPHMACFYRCKRQRL